MRRTCGLRAEMGGADICSSDSCLKWRSRVLRPVLSARKRSKCLTKVRMSGSPLSPKFPTVAQQRSESSASVHSGGRIETSGTAPSIYTLYLSLSTITLVYCWLSCSLVSTTPFTPINLHIHFRYTHKVDCQAYQNV